MILMSTKQEPFQIGAAFFVDLLDKLPCMGYSCVIIKFNARKEDYTMARETQKEKIERLEAENAQLEQRIAEYHKAWAEAERQKSAAVQETDEYKALEKALAAERLKVAEATRLYQRATEKQEQLRNENIELRKSYDALTTAYSALESDYKRVCEELQHMPAKEPHNARGAGRKPKITQEQRETAQKMHAEGLSSRKIATAVNLSPSTVLRILRNE